MNVRFFTLFPEFFTSPLHASLFGKAREKHIVRTQVIDIRDFSRGVHRQCDDAPYGGGPGMVMQVAPIAEALKQHDPEWKKHNVLLDHENTTVRVLLSAKGALFDQHLARKLSTYESINLVCGHYQGVDERVADHYVDMEVSIGQYVLNGGEVAALVVAESVARLVPGFIGNEQSLVGETHDEPGVVAPPLYTRPEVYDDHAVPSVLLSGNHALIERWRQENACAQSSASTAQCSRAQCQRCAS
jgi:tRNA (guanine37-N1)-methyltransferase